MRTNEKYNNSPAPSTSSILPSLVFQAAVQSKVVIICCLFMFDAVLILCCGYAFSHCFVV